MFIDRPETDTLQKKLDQTVTDGMGTTLLVTGEPGIGKSTLVEQFLKACDRDYNVNVLTATGRCLDMDGVSRGYLPWKEVLIELDADKAAGKDLEKRRDFKKIVKTIFDETGSDWMANIPQVGEICAAVRDTAQSIKNTERLDVAHGETIDLNLKERLQKVANDCAGSWLGAIPVVGNLAEAIYETAQTIRKKGQDIWLEDQEHFFILIMSRLRELSRVNPVVVFLDDLQWADIHSLSLFFFLSKNLKDKPYPLLLIGAYRPHDIEMGRLNPVTGEMERHPLPEKINNLQRYNAVETLDIGFFSHDQTTAYVTSRFPQNNFPAKFFRQLEDLTQGNPLFVQESINNLLELGSIVEREDIYMLIDDIDYAQIPRTIEGVITERYQRLNIELQEILKISAVQGEDFSLEIVAELIQTNLLKLHNQMDLLLNRHQLVRKAEIVRGKLTRIYQFVHNLVQKYIYFQMDISYRRDVHKLIAESLKGMLTEEQLSELAEQYSYHLGVGHQIIDENRCIILDKAHFESANFTEYAHGLESLIQKYKDREYNREDLKKYQDHLIELYMGSAKHHKEFGDRSIQLSHLNKAGKILIDQGKYDTALVCYRSSQADAEELNEYEPVINALDGIARAYNGKAEYDQFMETNQEILKLARDADDQRRMSLSYSAIGMAYAQKGELNKSIEYFQKALTIDQESEFLDGIAVGYNNISMVLRKQGNVDKAINYVHKALEIAKEKGDKPNLALRYNNLAILYYDKQKYEDASNTFKKALSIVSELGDKTKVGQISSNIGMMYMRKKDFDGAIKFFEEAIDLAIELDDQIRLAHFSYNLSQAHKQLNEYELALKYLLNASEIWKYFGLIPTSRKLTFTELETEIQDLKQRMEELG